MAKIEVLRLAAEQALAALRAAIEEPVLVRYSEHVTLEVRPAAEHEDERVQVCREGWGWTCVNYTHEGVIVDVFDNANVESLSTLCIAQDELITLAEEV